MFGLGVPEMLVIAVIALIIFGPKRLPEMGKSVGQALREFKKGADSVADEVKAAADVSDITKEVGEIKDELNDAGKKITEPIASAGSPAEPQKEPAPK